MWLEGVGDDLAHGTAGPNPSALLFIYGAKYS
jgi:hypothetical protein